MQACAVEGVSKLLLAGVLTDKEVSVDNIMCTAI
jgi:hypothetical protein